MATTEDDLDTIPEDKLLALPSQALPGGLSRLWAIRSNAIHEREVNELALELAGDTSRHLMISPEKDPKEKRRREEEKRLRAWLEKEAMREIGERSDRLLARIEDERREIDKRRKQIEDNALRLHDGRRVYVDGDRYRDGEGRGLTGADEAEAARQHQYQPNASTWGQKQDNARQDEEMRKLKDKILKDREEGIGPEEAGNRLMAYEKEFAQQAQERAAQASVNFGSEDYLADYGVPTTVPAFTQAADPVTRETIRKLAGDEGTGAAELQNKPRPSSGQGGLKL
ncbi:MAG TPA: hypothetical protein VNY05_12965 [Candidatus Acidoferrales bacterium]|jgi:hypothetical protein|nr:hypothetical protein [Candidatus Acidoferrales bacterium]